MPKKKEVKTKKTIHLDNIAFLVCASDVNDVLLQYAKQKNFVKEKPKKKKKRRKKYRDKRNWKEYNVKLVKRGEFYINPKFLETWNEEIKEMNAGKVGNPYLYPSSLIELLAVLHEKNFDCRSLQGIMSALSKRLDNFPVISYSQINRRINALSIEFDHEFEEKLDVGIDGSGNKVSNRGGWMRHKWKVRRGWIKVVIMGTLDGRIVDVRVGNEDLDERKAGRGMLRKNKKKIKKAIMDGLHDCEDTFDLCDELGIEPVIKVRKNASENGFSRRAKEVRLYKEIGHKRWVKKKGYGLRWPSSEGIFSGTKRIFGECVTATKKRNMYQQAKRKLWAYNKLLEIT
jgi:hypothetical protein